MVTYTMICDNYLRKKMEILIKLFLFPIIVLLMIKFLVRLKKRSLVSGNRLDQNVLIFFSLTSLHCQMCIVIYIFKFKKQQANKQRKETRIKKAKETNEEKRISLENRLKK